MRSDSSATPEEDPGWIQGSLLPEDAGVLPLQWVHPDSPASKPARGAVTAAGRSGAPLDRPLVVPGPAKQGDRMMVITQACDLVKPPAVQPQVEIARVFETEKPQIVAQAQDFGSARYHRVNDPDHSPALVLDFGQRAFLDKGFLEAVEPDNAVCGAWTKEQAKTFARWLGQRHSRPAIPDQDHEEIVRPIREAWKQLLEEDPDTAAEYNREYAEWRYRREADGTLTLYILAAKEHPDAEVALDVIQFLTGALAGSYPGQVKVPTDHRSYHTFTISEQLTTEQISMEWASQDEVGDAALPAP
jgi:hypothetical protein